MSHKNLRNAYLINILYSLDVATQNNSNDSEISFEISPKCFHTNLRKISKRVMTDLINVSKRYPHKSQ